jgi:THAP4-like, heme-binding beta-barrel domain
MHYLLISLVIVSFATTAQPSRPDSTWQALDYFIGSWSGEGSGQPGKGTYTRSYEWKFGRTFIECKNTSVYPPREGQSTGEIHEDIGFFSYDKGRKRVILRQFHKEGFVNQYVLDSFSGGTEISFVTEGIENIPAGWRAKERYTIKSSNEFVEVFELAPPGGAFSTYTTVTFHRSQPR